MKRMVCVLALAAALGTTALAGARLEREKNLQFIFVDVEGGAATLTVTPEGESILVDSGWPGRGGRDAQRIAAAAKVAGVTQIDHYVTTHWHTDHYGGIEDLAKLMPVKNFWDRGIPEKATDGADDFPTLIAAYNRANGGKHRTLKPGDKLPLKKGAIPLEIRCIAGGGKVLGEGKQELAQFCAAHPTAPVKDESDNMLSLGLLLKFGEKFQFLNCGDLTWNIEHKLACPKNRLGQVDLFQVTHHGAPQSSNPALISAIAPQVAVIVNGPRKGGDPRTFATLKKQPSLEAIYQLHLNVGSGVDDNTTPERIANIDEQCQGEFLRVLVSPNADRYTVSKGASKNLQTFMVK